MVLKCRLLNLWISLLRSEPFSGSSLALCCKVLKTVKLSICQTIFEVWQDCTSRLLSLSLYFTMSSFHTFFFPHFALLQSCDSFFFKLACFFSLCYFDPRFLASLNLFFTLLSLMTLSLSNKLGNHFDIYRLFLNFI